MPEPPWDAPAHLWGLPVTSWKTKAGFDLHGTLAECITRWLSLAAHHQRNCEMSCREAAPGVWEAERIGAYIRTHGLPPAMLAARSGAVPSPEELERLTSMAWLEPPRPGPGAGDASVHCQSFQPAARSRDEKVLAAAQSLILSFGGTASVDASEAAQAADDTGDADGCDFWWAAVEQIRKIQGA